MDYNPRKIEQKWKKYWEENESMDEGKSRD